MVSVATGDVIGGFSLVGKTVIGPPQAQKLLANLIDTTLDPDELAHALDGYTNGYWQLLQDSDPVAQTAAVGHEFCTNPLHPGPCKGWKKKPPDVDDTGPPAPAKTVSKASPKATKAQVTESPKASTSRPRRLTEKQIQAMPDDELFDLFAALSKQDTLDEPLMQRLIKDMDRREQNPDGTEPAELELTPQQRRVDELVSKGRDFLSAYAEVHGKDEGKLREEAGASTIDRRAKETKAQAVRRSYDEFTHVNYLKAEKATRGNMLNRAGKAAGVDPLELFTGPVSRARRYASEELQRWWTRNGRMNLTQFKAQVLGGAKDKAAAEKTRKLSNAKDFI